MAKKKELDKLSLDMIECEKAGYGCHYGAWKAAQDNPVEIIATPYNLPKGWQRCAWCGTPFKPTTKRKQLYCEVYCQRVAQRERDRAKRNEYKREWRAKKAAERSGENG